MRKRSAILLLASLALFACIDQSRGNRTVEGAGGPQDDSAVCSSCQQRAGGETSDFGASPGQGSQSCSSVEAPLTADVERTFELDALRTYLASPHVVSAEPREVPGAQSGLQGPIEIAFEFEVGAFTYRTGERCDSVWATVKLNVEVGDGWLAFSADGVLWKQPGALHAHLYASTDLASATGSYRPQVDRSRPHAGQIEVSINVFPDQLRGSVIPELLYFANQGEADRYLSGDRDFVYDLDALEHLDFPVDECRDHEWPLSADATLERLGGRSPAQLRSDVTARIGTVAPFNAVWGDGRTTAATVELMESSGGTVCARADDALPNSEFSGSELIFRMPMNARLRTEDGKVDLAFDQLTIAVGSEDDQLRWSMLRGVAPSTPGERLDGRISYSFANGAVDASGIVELQKETTPGAAARFDCIAFPVGGKTDESDCRYMR